MKVVSWNVRGACSPHTKYIHFTEKCIKEWDTLFVVVHKCHDLAGIIIYLRGD